MGGGFPVCTGKGGLASQHALGRGGLHPGGGESASKGERVCIQGGRGWVDPPEILEILPDTVNERAVGILL